MTLSSLQLAAVLEAKKLLADVGLTTPKLSTNLDDTDFLEVTRIISQSLPNASSCSAFQGSLYVAPPARPFSAEEIRRGLNRINRQKYVYSIVEHPVGSIVEYPETGISQGVSIAHLFSVDPSSLSHPKESFQYSLGDSQGGEPYVHCGSLLTGRNGRPTSCAHKRLACRFFIDFEASNRSSLTFHRQRVEVFPPLPPLYLDGIAQAKKEIFFKTLGFYCTLVEKGCGFDLRADAEDIDLIGLDDADDSESDESETETGTTVIKDCRRRNSSRSLCKGKLEMRRDEYGRSFVQCQYHNLTDKSHLILRTLDEFDIPYLRALLENDSRAIDEREELARQFGYGPPYWHRAESGKLARGILQRLTSNCSAKFDIYTPYDLSDCPRIVVVCLNPHSHPDPRPAKTPPPLLEVFRSLLLDLDWKLADATPRKLMIDSGFMAGLRRALGWNKPFDPPLAALHPSLGNLDHVRRYIDKLRGVLFPSGTGFEGAQIHSGQWNRNKSEEQYVRCAETHTIEDGKTFHLVICMLRSMSALLMRSKKLSLDTAFKRLNGKWQEFEMETWELDQMKSVIGTRAFTTSQSAEAHLILFTRIFDIAHEDTGVPCHFRLIHGDGFELWIADAHKGQALGAGMWCQKLSAELVDVYCPLGPTRLLRALDPYDHLRRFLRLCTTHFKRHVDDLRPSTTQKVRNAMLSLSSSQPHPNLEGAFRIIENGGRKAKAWLKDKRVGSKFALPALYQPLSLIPIEIWKSAPSTTNGNEQAHRNINRDGVNLTMLGGIMRGMQYDARAMGALELPSTQGIYSRDQTATHFRRLQRSLNRHSKSPSRIHFCHY
ncbi:hypothetical protein DFH09DRAFT_919678 [Mycena vulgaris]|nr:hypothetical protein DFH09DRAFT_919678 [Mycena vulgaris]